MHLQKTLAANGKAKTEGVTFDVHLILHWTVYSAILIQTGIYSLNTVHNYYTHLYGVMVFPLSPGYGTQLLGLCNTLLDHGLFEPNGQLFSLLNIGKHMLIHSKINSCLSTSS